MPTDPLMEVRTALTTTTNNDWSGGTTLGGTEINKRVERIITDNINRDVDLRPLVKRKPNDQLAYIWNIRTDLGSTGKAAFYSDGGAGTPYPSTKVPKYAVTLSYRGDYEVTGLAQSSMRSYYNALEDEARDALDALKLLEERSMICGSVTGAYGYASAFTGLLELMRWNTSNGGDTEGTAANRMLDTTTVFGTARAASGVNELDVSYVLAGTVGTSTGVLELKHMDKSITRSNKKGGKGAERIFFCSEERGDEVNQLLQPQQRFVAGAGQLELEGGFKVTTYRNVPIVSSRFMDKNGATNTGSWDKDTDADNSMYLLNLSQIEMRVLNGIDFRHVPIMGQGDSTNYLQRADATGGYFKTYAVFVMKHFNSQVHIGNLTAPA